MWCDRSGVGLHPAVFAEDRGQGVRLYTRAAMSAGTVVAVVPSSTVFASSTAACATLPVAMPAVCAREKVRTPVINAIFSVSASQTWAELAWRLAMELCCGNSRWWGWMGQLPTAAAMHDSFHGDLAQSAFVGAGHAGDLPYWRKLAASLQAETDAMYDALASDPATIAPPRATFRYATQLVLRRSQWVPRAGHDLRRSAQQRRPEPAPELALVPLLDCVELHHATAKSGDDARGGLGKVHAAIEVMDSFREGPSWYADHAEATPAETEAMAVTGDASNDAREASRKQVVEALAGGGSERFALVRREGIASFYLCLTLERDADPAASISLGTALPPTPDSREYPLLSYARLGSVDPSF
jgi:hypothetical protein